MGAFVWKRRREKFVLTRAAMVGPDKAAAEEEVCEREVSITYSAEATSLTICAAIASFEPTRTPASGTTFFLSPLSMARAHSKTMDRADGEGEDATRSNIKFVLSPPTAHASPNSELREHYQAHKIVSLNMVKHCNMFSATLFQPVSCSICRLKIALSASYLFYLPFALDGTMVFFSDFFFLFHRFRFSTSFFFSTFGSVVRSPVSTHSQYFRARSRSHFYFWQLNRRSRVAAGGRARKSGGRRELSAEETARITRNVFSRDAKLSVGCISGSRDGNYISTLRVMIIRDCDELAFSGLWLFAAI